MKHILKKISIAVLSLVIFAGLNTPYAEALIVDNSNIEQKSWHRTLFDGVDERLFKTNPTNILSDTSGSMFAYFTFSGLSSLADGNFMNIGGFGDTTSTSAYNQINLGVRRDDTAFGSSSARRMGFFLRKSSINNEVVGNINLVDGRRYFVVVTSNGSTWKMYVNGVEQTLTVRLGSNSGDWMGDLSLPGTKYFSIGNVFRQNAWAPVSMDGYVGGFGITSEVLTQAQITALYNLGRPIDPFLVIDKSQVRSFYTMGDLESGSITTMYDATGTNHLTSQNMEDADIVASNYYDDVFDPIVYNPMLWIDASDTSTLFDATSGGSLPSIGSGVARIEDKSGNMYNFQQATSGNRPNRELLNGLSSLDFDGSTDNMDIGVTNLGRNVSGVTIYTVRQADTVGGGANAVTVALATSSLSQNRLYQSIFNTTGFSGGGGRTLDADSFATVDSNPTVASTGVAKVQTLVYDIANTDIYTYINNTLLGTNTSYQTATTTSNTASTNGALGASSSGTSAFFDGKIGEILIFHAVHDTKTREAITNYLIAKWGIS